MNLKNYRTPEDWIGYRDHDKSVEYNYRDVVLYAVAVGAGKDELQYVWEKSDDFQAIPTFAVEPSFCGYHQPRSWTLNHPSMLVQESLGDAEGMDFSQEFFLYRPFDPLKGTFIWHNEINKIYDRGPGKGILCAVDQPIYDEACRPLGKLVSTTVVFAGGGFGGEKPPKPVSLIPDRVPDYVKDEWIPEMNQVIYGAATGTSIPVHSDGEYCRRIGMKDVVIHGQVVFGYAARMAIEGFIPGEGFRMTHMFTSIRNPTYPNSHIRFEGWKIAEGKVAFRLTDTDTDRPLLINGLFEYRE